MMTLNILSTTFSDILNELQLTSSTLLMSCFLVLFMAGFYWFICCLWKDYQSRLNEIQKLKRESQFSLRIDYYQLANLYSDLDENDHLDKEFETLLEDTIGRHF